MCTDGDSREALLALLNWALRYEPIVRFLEEVGGNRILEVGSGSSGLVEYYTGFVVGVDVAFLTTTHHGLVPVRASVLRLPFPDESFDVVISSDMLEHVPTPARRAAITEMGRVAGRYLVIGFPSGEVARKHDEAVASKLDRLRIRRPPWLVEHLADDPPVGAEVEEAVGSSLLLTERRRNSNSVLHQAVVTAELLPGLWRVASRINGMKAVRVLAPILNRGSQYREILIFSRQER